jgi:diacylglycerol kinase family enzyme
MMGMNSLVLVNPVSSGGRGARVWSHIEPAIRSGRPGLQVHLTRGHDDAERTTRSWAAGGGTELLVVGGDGTLHEAVNGLAGAGRLDAVRVAVIPAGTGNDFARSIGVRTGALPAREGAEIAVDLGRLRFETQDGRERTRVFLNSVSVGLSVRGNALAHRLRRRLPGAACYVLGGIGALLLERRARRPVLRLRVDGRLVYEGKALNLTVSNGLKKLAEMSAAEGRLAFGCGMPHDLLTGMLLPRALNVRAVLREEEMAATRGVLAAPSAQKE